MLEFKLLSKVLDEKNFHILTTYNVNEQDFTEGLGAYKFIKSFVFEHKTTPSADAVASEADFEYFETQDNFKYLCSTLKSNSAKRRAFDVLQNQAGEKFSSLKGHEFVEWLQEEVNQIASQSKVKSGTGTNWANNGAERWEMYQQTKQKETNLVIPTPYPTLNQWMAGGNDLGDYVMLMSYSNQGKSWLASDFGLASWRAGFPVLHYSPEMSQVQTQQRLDTLNGHFSNIHMASGELFDKVEQEFAEYLTEFTDNDTPYIIKTMEDLEDGLSIEHIEADLNQNPNIKFVIIDGFNLMTHKGRDGTRNNMTATSRALRKLFGKHGVVGMVVHHTNTDSQRGMEDGFVVPPLLTDYSETVAVTQDPCTVLTYAHQDGVGALAVRKARKPCVDKILDLHVNYNMGFINEVKTSGFGSQFGDEDDI